MQSENSRGHVVHVQLYGQSWAFSEPFLAIRWHSPLYARDFGSKNDQSSQSGRVWHKSRHWDFWFISIAEKIYSIIFCSSCLLNFWVFFFCSKFYIPWNFRPSIISSFMGNLAMHCCFPEILIQHRFRSIPVKPQARLHSRGGKNAMLFGMLSPT